MKIFICLFLFVLPLNLFSCSCDTDYSLFEYTGSKYVFQGKIISKVYAKDKKKYKVIFEVIKHYKNSNDPDKIEFELDAEERYTGKWSSCDFSVSVGETWLIFAHENLGYMYFSEMCSNSRRIDVSPLNNYEIIAYENAKNFNSDDYIFQFELLSGFNNTKLTTVLKAKSLTTNKNLKALLLLKINKEGTREQIFINKELLFKKDSIFNLTTEISQNKNYSPSPFENEAVEIVKNIKDFKIKKYVKTNTKISYLSYVLISYDSETYEWTINKMW